MTRLSKLERRGFGMNKPVVFGAAAVAIIAAIGVWLLQGDAPPSQEQISTGQVSAPAAATQPSNEMSPAAAAQSQEQISLAPLAKVEEEDEYSEDPVKMFSADASGNLVLKERTRINVEKMLWIYSPEEQKQRLAVIEQGLPPSAYRQLVDLMERYQTMTTAVKQTYPPNVAPSTVEEAIAQHEGLSALRKSHLGASAMEAMFGQEEKINRQLLDFMNLEKHEGLTMEEKTQKAQELLSRSPELAAAYETNRTAPNAK